MNCRSAFGAILVGGGPAGIAVLLSAHRDGRLGELLRNGLLVLERGPEIGKGKLGDYAINSDSTGETFVDPLRASTEPLLHAVLAMPVAQRIAAAGSGAVPLSEVGDLMSEIGKAMLKIISTHPRSAVLTMHTAESAYRQEDGEWRVEVTDGSGRKRLFRTPNLILATGAHQPKTRLQTETLTGARIHQRWGNRLLQSGEVLRHGGLRDVRERLKDIANPRVAILGGSTSAIAISHTLLHRCPQVAFGRGGITVFHRRALRIYYTGVDEARADGYEAFGPEDVCPVTNRVFRFAGLRLDSRELLMRVLGIGGREPEPRLHLHQLQAEDPQALAKIDSAHVVIAALGYRPRAIRLCDSRGLTIPLLAHQGPGLPLVDRCCRVLDKDRQPIEGVFGIGLAAGFMPSGRFGGEPSFSGQANGLWLWQNGVGTIIADAVLNRALLQRRRRRSERMVQFPMSPQSGARLAERM